MKFFSAAKTTILVVLIVSSIALNVATVTSTVVATTLGAIFTAATGIASVAGYKTNESKARDKKRIKTQKIVRKITTKISRRVVAGTTRNLGTMFAEAIPYFGVAAIVGSAAWDLKDTCETLKDLRQLNSEFNPDDGVDNDAAKVCDQQVPTSDEVWLAVEKSPRKAWETAKSNLPDLADMTQIVDNSRERFYRGSQKIGKFLRSMLD